MKTFFKSILIWALLLSSCTTTTQRVPYSIPEDKIIAFAGLKQRAGEIDTNSLIMFGEKLNYVIPPSQSAALLNLLNAGFSQRYKIDGGNAFKIIIKDNNNFDEQFCLSYELNNENEKEKLLSLGFELNKENHYKKCLSVSGKIYGVDKQQVLPQDYIFKTPIIVKLNMLKTSSHISGDLFAPLGLVIAIPLIPLFALAWLPVAICEPNPSRCDF